MFFLETQAQREARRVQGNTQRSRDTVELSRFIELLRRDLRDGTASNKNQFEWLKPAFSKNPGTSLIQYSFARGSTTLTSRFNFELAKWTADSYYNTSRTSLFDGLGINLLLEELKKQKATLFFEDDDIFYSQRENSFHYLYNGFRTQEPKLRVKIHFWDRDVDFQLLDGYFTIDTTSFKGKPFAKSFKQKFSLLPKSEKLVDVFNGIILDQRMRNSLARRYDFLPNAEPLARKEFKNVLSLILSEVPVEVVNPEVLGKGRQLEVQRGVFKYTPIKGVDRGVEIEVRRTACCGAPYSIAARSFEGQVDAATTPFLPSDVHKEASSLLAGSITPCTDNTYKHYSISESIEDAWSSAHSDKSYVAKYEFKKD